MVGGIAKNSKNANVIACIMYFPMLIFSGATLPFEILPTAIQKIVNIFPITQGIKPMKSIFRGLTIDNALFPVVIMVVTSAVCIWVSVKFFKWE